MPFSKLAAFLLIEVLVLHLLATRSIAGPERDEHFKSPGKTSQSNLSRGYDLQVVSGTTLLESQSDSQPKFEHVALRAMKLSEFQKAVNDAAALGFRLSPESVYVTQGSLSRVRVGGVAVKARSAPFIVQEPGTRYEYRLLDASEKAIAKLASEGFRVISLPDGQDDEGYPHDYSLLERRVNTSDGVAPQPLPREHYKLLKNSRVLDGPASPFTEAVRDGYRLVFVSQSQRVILLEQRSSESTRPDYLLVRSRFYLRRHKAEEMLPRLESDLNDAASSGYRLLSNRIFLGDAGGRALAFNEYVAIMERIPEPMPPVRYMVVRDLAVLNRMTETEAPQEVSVVGQIRSGVIVELPRH